MLKLSKMCVISFIALCLVSGSALALPLSLDTGTPLIMIDGDFDTNVNIINIDISSYILGYYLNGDSLLKPATLFFPADEFAGGDVVDFALRDNGAN